MKAIQNEPKTESILSTKGSRDTSTQTEQQDNSDSFFVPYISISKEFSTAISDLTFDDSRRVSRNNDDVVEQIVEHAEHWSRQSKKRGFQWGSKKAQADTKQSSAEAKNSRSSGQRMDKEPGYFMAHGEGAHVENIDEEPEGFGVVAPLEEADSGVVPSADLSTQALTPPAMSVPSNGILTGTDFANENTSLLSGTNDMVARPDKFEMRMGLNLRSGSKLWNRARNHLDSALLLSTGSSSIAEHADDEETPLVRTERLKKEQLTVIRKSVEFSLAFCLLVMVAYLGLGTIAYSLLFESWTALDALYFSIAAFCTVGYGDLTPTNDSSRLFTCFYAVGGTAWLGIVLGVLGSNLLEAEVRAQNHARQVSQFQVLSLFEQNDEPSTTEEEIYLKQSTGASKVGEGKWCSKSAYIQVLPAGCILSALAWLISRESGWDFVSTLYFCITTATTAGFGDFVPPTPFARLLAVFFIPVAVLFMTEWLTMTANTMIAQRQAAFRKSYETKELTMLDIEMMDTNGDGKIDRAEYLEFMLLAMAKVDQPLLDDLRTLFNRLDVAKTGYLDRDNMKAMAKKKLRSARRKLELAAYKKRLLDLTPTMQSHR